MNEILQQNGFSNRYKLNEEIGSGGMAIVYEGYDETLERQVAIKMLRERFAKHSQFRLRFHEEAKAAANLNHQNIVTIFDFGRNDDSSYIVMEYVPGIDLNSMIQKNHKQEGDRLTFRQGIDLIIQASKGLGYAHKAGIVHCDVKPHNFLVTPQNVLKVTDFGIAQAFSSFKVDENNDTIWGSPIYLSPEQAAGTHITPASDIYSLGVIMYYLFAGQFPFVADTPEKLSYKHQFEKPKQANVVNPQIPTQLNKIIMQLLDKDPNKRYRSADHLAHVLIEKFQDSSVNAPIYLPIRDTILSTEGDTVPTQVQKNQNNELQKLNINWGNVLLTFLAVFLVGGLFPFWLWILLLL